MANITIHLHDPSGRVRTYDTAAGRLAAGLWAAVRDAEFEESEHPRAPDGKFAGAGGGGSKPTKATAKGSKAGVHELLSSGHGFTLQELMEATGTTNKSTLMTALSDLKSPKYAGTLGHLEIVQSSSGHYLVKPEGWEGAAKAPRASSAPRTEKGTGMGASTPSEAESGPSAWESSREGQHAKTYSRLNDEMRDIEDDALRDAVDNVIDSARVNADDTIDLEKERKPHEWDEMFRDTIESILSFQDTPRVRAWFDKHFAEVEPAGLTPAQRKVQRWNETLKRLGKEPLTLSAKPAAPAPTNKYHAGADAIAAMSEHDRDNTAPADMPGGWHAYNLYEARKLAPKDDGKLKRITENNSFTSWQDYDYVTNVDGHLFGVVKEEDPDNDEDADPDDSSFKHVYAYTHLDSPLDTAVSTHISVDKENVPELLAHIRSHKLEPAAPVRAKTAEPVAPKPKEVKHTPVTGVYSPHQGGGYVQGYTTTPAQHREATHLISGKSVPSKKVDVYHNGEKIGAVESYRGQKDGPKINAAGVVAWRKDQLQYSGQYDKSIGASYRHTTLADAIRSVVQTHEHTRKKP